MAWELDYDKIEKLGERRRSQVNMVNIDGAEVRPSLSRPPIMFTLRGFFLQVSASQRNDGIAAFECQGVKARIWSAQKRKWRKKTERVMKSWWKDRSYSLLRPVPKTEKGRWTKKTGRNRKKRHNKKRWKKTFDRISLSCARTIIDHSLRQGGKWDE